MSASAGPRLSRRAFLGAAAVAASAGSTWALAGRRPSGLKQRVAVPPVDLPVVASPPRALVVLELDGGNDGLSMLVPYADPLYAKLRPRTAVSPTAVLPLDASVGLHPRLVTLQRTGVAWIQGVGVAHPDLSHFEMLNRWWTADPDGRRDGPAADGTGVLGRLCDLIGDPSAPAVGITATGAPTPMLRARRVGTAAVTGGDSFPVPGDDAEGHSWQQAWNSLNGAVPGAPAILDTARFQGRRAVAVSSLLGALPPASPAYPAGDLARGLALAARLLAASAGVRIVHVPANADFDTHIGHRDRYAAIVADLDAALGAFFSDLRLRGLWDSTVIMSVSEFGRRPEDNGSSGLDHGTASVAFMAGGPVRPGLYGRQPSLADLDGDGNLLATTDMTSYYATVSAWLGVDPPSVLPGNPRPIPGVLS